ncbi:unnamed protein product [Rotaria sp. Silwood1]|nr:unnamed protein product [Rotaria sp. Silwood1]CAF3467943.1 unnamed protein product [Rotaria sp. Silwood1]CAF3489482.1 unnamed protein product [Rotaria sp. Silwood1]CAF4742103.1 unnamed protein product [Rotaria sp. Silwood1]CAF4931895.1 unnamed protein product [Rotaria sp. Silwood1]
MAQCDYNFHLSLLDTFHIVHNHLLVFKGEIICLICHQCQIFISAAIVKHMIPIDDINIVKSASHLHTNTGKVVKNHGSLSDDIIELNIGGQKMTTLRSTLTAVPNSKLALMFSKENMNKTLSLDKQGAIFFDYNPIYFNYLLDQLRIIKRMSNISGYQLQLSSPFINTHINFTHMLIDLGLTPDHFLSPMEGTHINLTVKSLIGWKECYRSTYNVSFDLSILTKFCNGSRLLVACRSVNNKKILTLAGIGQREDILHPCLPKQCKTNGKSMKLNKKFICSSHHQCITQAKRGVGWYHVNNQTWGFVRGSLSFVVNPCDSSNLDSDYRLCWTLQSNVKKISGDRCGSTQNLQKSNQWERLIYYIN